MLLTTFFGPRVRALADCLEFYFAIVPNGCVTTFPNIAPPSIAEKHSLEIIKTAAITEGVRISEAAMAVLMSDAEQLSIHEYPTTGGITLELEADVFVNAPFDEWYCETASTTLSAENGNLFLQRGDAFASVIRVVPLPGYLDKIDHVGRKASAVAMSHLDRIRLSPIKGCAYDCGFCDIPNLSYEMRVVDQLTCALDIAMQDKMLPPRHVLISGGSPRRAHYEQFELLCRSIIEHSPLPVDLMMSPMVDNLSFIDRLAAHGLAGMSINLEVFSDSYANIALGRKYRTSHKHLAPFIERAVDKLGVGNVRSAIIPGLEPLEQTLEGIEFLCELGCVPMLSPFRPTAEIRLNNVPPPTFDDMTLLLQESRSIVEKYDIGLGPKCLHCLHNVLGMPWDVRHA